MERWRAVDPVFVDRSGRRRRLITLAGTASGLVLAVVVLAFAAGFTRSGPASAPSWPDAAADRPTARVPQTSPTPAAPRATPQPATAAPARPGAGAGTTPVARPTSPPARATATASASTAPTPRNNGRRPTHTPNPHSARSR